MNNDRPSGTDDDDEGNPLVTNIVLVVFFLAVIGAGWWLVDAMIAQRKIDDCAAQGRRNCVPLDVRR